VDLQLLHLVESNVSIFDVDIGKHRANLPLSTFCFNYDFADRIITLVKCNVIDRAVDLRLSNFKKIDSSVNWLNNSF